MPHRFLVWTVRPLLVVVAKLRTNKEKDKKALGLEIGNSHVDSLHFRLYAPFFIYYLYVYRGDSLTLGIDILLGLLAWRTIFLGERR